MRRPRATERRNPRPGLRRRPDAPVPRDCRAAGGDAMTPWQGVGFVLVVVSVVLPVKVGAVVVALRDDRVGAPALEGTGHRGVATFQILAPHGVGVEVPGDDLAVAGAQPGLRCALRTQRLAQEFRRRGDEAIRHRCTRVAVSHAPAAARQRSDGSWASEYRGGVEVAPAAESNHAGYLAVGTWHTWVVSGDEDLVTELWPAVRRGLDLVVRMQLPGGAVSWALRPDGTPDDTALLTGNASLFQALRCGIALAAPRAPRGVGGLLLGQACVVAGVALASASSLVCLSCSQRSHSAGGTSSGRRGSAANHATAISAPSSTSGSATVASSTRCSWPTAAPSGRWPNASR